MAARVPLISVRCKTNPTEAQDVQKMLHWTDAWSLQQPLTIK